MKVVMLGNDTKEEVTFSNTDEVEVIVPNHAFVHYADGSLATFKKAVVLNVSNVKSDSGTKIKSTNFYAVLKFEYERSFPKYLGNEIDITVNDMKKINLFGLWIDYWIMRGEGFHYTLDNVMSGDSIYYEYLWQPAQNILNAANSLDGLKGAYRTMVIDYTTPIVNNCVQGADFKALYFNGILYAINCFNLSVTV